MNFKELNLKQNVLRALEKNQFNDATEIQQKAIPLFLENKNVFGKSSTGTGKTAAFVLPILNELNTNSRDIQAIIMAPTRELAMQIVSQIRLFGSFINNLTIAPLIGGAQLRDQIKKMKQSQIVVGTPGRVNDHLKRKTLKLDNVKTIILDEADEMLKMGFKTEMDAIFESVPPTSQVGLFSATVTPKVLDLAKNYMNDYEMVEIKNQIKVNNNISNTFVFTKNIDKKELLVKLFEKHKPERAIIFSNTKSFTDKISEILKNAGLKSVVINGDKKQSQRSRSVNQFKNGHVNILVATDVVARGIDIKDVDYVVNYDVSRENEHFVHRIGRTGRNQSKGNSITFIDNKKTLFQLNDIKKEFEIVVDEIHHSEYGVQVKENLNNVSRGDNSRNKKNNQWNANGSRTYDKRTRSNSSRSNDSFDNKFENNKHYNNDFSRSFKNNFSKDKQSWNSNNQKKYTKNNDYDSNKNSSYKNKKNEFAKNDWNNFKNESKHRTNVK